MHARKNIERLFQNRDWPEFTDKRISEVVDRFYNQFGNAYAERFGESLGRYFSSQPSGLRELQSRIKDLSLIFLTSGFAGPKPKEKIKPSYVIYAKANVVLSHMERALRNKNYADVDYKEELDSIIAERINYFFR